MRTELLILAPHRLLAMSNMISSSKLIMSVLRLSSRVRTNCPQNSKLHGTFRLDTKSITRSAQPRDITTCSANSMLGERGSTLQRATKPATFSPGLQLSDPIGAKNCEVIQQVRLFSEVISHNHDSCVAGDHNPHDFSHIFGKGDLVPCHGNQEGHGLLYQEISRGSGPLFEDISKVDLEYDVHDAYGLRMIEKQFIPGKKKDHPFAKGLEKGLEGMREGGVRRIIVPPHHSHTSRYAVYAVKLVKVHKHSFHIF